MTMALYLASGFAAWVAGKVIFINGGIRFDEISSKKDDGACLSHAIVAREVMNAVALIANGAIQSNCIALSIRLFASDEQYYFKLP